jgi:hypothetical protein
MRLEYGTLFILINYGGVPMEQMRFELTSLSARWTNEDRLDQIMKFFVMYKRLTILDVARLCRVSKENARYLVLQLVDEGALQEVAEVESTNPHLPTKVFAKSQTPLF